MSKWKVFDANTGEVEVETYLKWAAVFIAWYWSFASGVSRCNSRCN